MADDKKRPIIVIKKIYESPAGAHGGAWKVAFADFMTAMMCFFLVMWLLNQSEEVKKQVASYFTGPSVLEQNFKAYGAELTLEKLFLDIVNEPLKTLQTVMEPADLTPNLMAMGSKKLVLQFLANEMGEAPSDVRVEENQVVIEIPDFNLFEPGTAIPKKNFADIMRKVQEVTKGIEDSDVIVESVMSDKSVFPRSTSIADQVSRERADLIDAKIEATLENQNVKSLARSKLIEYNQPLIGDQLAPGKIRLILKQKEILSDGRAPRPLAEVFGGKKADMSVYEDFVQRLSQQQHSGSKRKKQKSRE